MPLITTTDQIKDRLPVEVATFPKSFQGDVKRAEDQYIKKAIGQDVYDLLVADTPDADALALLEVVRDALAPLAYYLHTPKINVRVSDLGLTTAQSNSKERAGKWMVYDLRNQLLLDGTNALDTLLKYMEAHDDATWYSDWESSEAFTTYKGLFVNRAEIFGKHVNINDSRWLFMQMLPMVRNTEVFFVEPEIGAEFLADLKEKFAGNDLDADEETAAVALIQQCISLKCYAESLRDPKFLKEMVVVTANKQEELGTQENTMELLQAYEKLAIRYDDLATGALNKLRVYLNTNASSIVFPIYYASDRYKNPAASTGLKLDQRNDNKNSGSTFSIL